MRVFLLCVFTAAALLPWRAAADEGMWLPSQLPEIAKAMRAAGYQGDPATLADLTRHPMNAVVSLGGCTASFVSPDGLVVTNHHCAYGAIQLNSTPQKNLLETGFNAATQADEVSAGPAARVLVTTAFDRITDRILRDARGKEGRAYFDAVDAAGKAVIAECEAVPGNRCEVVSMHYGREFYRITQLELKDIRLVYAPPESIGSYGDEIDNFMWPRHSGDFTFYRAYVGKDGQPAAYSPDNVPYRPKAHLQVSTAAIGEGDFAMVAGYPGRTFRHRTASEFAEQVQWQLPARVALYRGLLDVADGATAGNDAAKVRYAAQVASMENTLKRAQGELDGLRRSDAVATRRADEQAMLQWLGTQPQADATGNAIRQVEALLADARSTRERDQILATLFAQTQLLRSARLLQRLALERGKPDALRESGYQQRDEVRIADFLKQLQRRYDPAVEQAIVLHLLGQYYALPADQHLPEMTAVFGADAATAKTRVAALYAQTTLGDEAVRLALLQAQPQAVAASTDALLKAAATLQPMSLRLEDRDKARDGDLLRLRPAYMAALIGFRQSRGEAVYPDANSTLRVSYGKVTALQPRDAVRYAPVTTVQGIIEKHTGIAPFDAPKPLRDAIAAGDFGSTADKALDTQTVNFLTNLDTTGGNSGSPVLDAHGRLIGLNFDSNWEAVSASWAFDPRYKRAIHVDMRYVRWLMSKVYPAPRLLRELDLPPE